MFCMLLMNRLSLEIKFINRLQTKKKLITIFQLF